MGLPQMSRTNHVPDLLVCNACESVPKANRPAAETSRRVLLKPRCMLILNFALLCVICGGFAKAEALRVHLYDYAGVSMATLNEARGHAEEALSRAGVRVTWVHCPTPDCAPPLSPRVLQLRILERRMAGKWKASDECLGYALVVGDFSSVASVFYHKAVELEQGSRAGRGQILGAAMAHEIGHLLLGRNSHSPQGIMRAMWDRADFLAIARGRMRFSPPEAKRLSANAEARMRAAAETN